MESVSENELAYLFKDDLTYAELLGKERICVPLVKIKRSESALELRIVAPGVRKEDFRFGVHNGVMMVHGRTTKVVEIGRAIEHGANYECVSFSREFLIPHDVDVENIELDYADEILHVRLPRVQH